MQGNNNKNNRGRNNRSFRGGQNNKFRKKRPDDDNDSKSIQLEGVIHTVLPGTMFRVELPNGKLVLAHISGKMRKRFIKLVIGDRVKIEMSPYDLEKARIVFRL